MTVRIAQISDIHWRGMQRHPEYTKAFKRLFSQLEEQQPDLIVCTGDIFHTKTQNITPEVIDKLVWMFKGLATVAPLHMILGNHDGNLANEDRQDAISPIIEAMNDPRIFLYKKSGTYQVPNTNISLGAFSCFDKDGWYRTVPEKGRVNIALFHGSISGCETDGRWRISHGEATTQMFEGWDLAMLGDIHKQQFLGYKSHGGVTRGMKPWVGYPGSLIQQNYGEDVTKGYYLWKIHGSNRFGLDWDVDFCELENMSPYLTLPWNGSVVETVAQLDSKLVKNAKIRIASVEPISRLDMKQLSQLLCDIGGAKEVITKIDSTNRSATVEAGGVSVKKTSLRNNPSALKQLYRDYVRNNADKFPLTEAQLQKGEEYLQNYLTKLSETEQEDMARDIVWSIKSLEFENLYRYGSGNKLDFENMSGIVGIFGPNKVGKSSIIGSLMLGLYNTTDRGSVKSAYIVNKAKPSGFSRVKIRVGNKDYVVIRKIEKSLAKRTGVVDEEKAATTLNLFRVEPNGTMVDATVSENGDTRQDTDKVIRSLIGTSNDFLLTAFSNQGGINKFIEEGATERKAILNRFLDLDVFEKLYQLANNDRALMNSKIHKFDPIVWDAVVMQTQKRQQVKEQKATELQGSISALRSKVSDLKNWLQTHEGSNHEDISAALSKLERETEAVTKQLASAVVRCSKLKQEINEAERATGLLLDELADVDPRVLEEKKEALVKLRTTSQQTSSTYEREKDKLNSQKKNVRKLDLVPCGDTFPNCHYIKDAHEDKKLVVEQSTRVNDLLQTVAALKEELQFLEDEKIDKKLQEYATKKERLAGMESRLVALRRELFLSEESKKTLAEAHTTKQEALKACQEKIKLFEGDEYGNNQNEFRSLSATLMAEETKLSQLYMEIGADKNKLASLKQEKEDALQLNGELKIIESVAQGFSKNGIPALVLKTQLPALNQELEKVLTGVVDFKVTLETEVNSNSLEVYIEDAHSRRVIELGSGMEKMISSLAIRVALINLSSLPKPDVFIVDEGFGTLDEEGLQKCMQLLSLMRTYFKTVLVISHVPQIKEVADRIIEIKNLGTESKVQA